MNFNKNKIFLIIILFIAIIISFSLIQLNKTLNFSPKKNQVTNFNNFLEAYNNDIIEKLEQEARISSQDECKPICKDFERSTTIKGDPFDGEVEDARKMKKEKDEINKDMDDFLKNEKCPGKCKKVSETKSLTVIIQPISPQPGWCAGEHSFSIDTTGESLAGCDLAKLDALKKFGEKIRDLIKDKCGSGCDATIKIVKSEDSGCYREGWFTTKIDVHTEGTITCIGKPKNNEYEIILRGKACVVCEGTQTDGGVAI